MLAHAPGETEMLSQHFAWTVLHDLGEAQGNLGCYRKSDKTLRTVPLQTGAPREIFWELDSFQLKSKNLSGYANAL